MRRDLHRVRRISKIIIRPQIVIPRNGKGAGDRRLNDLQTRILPLRSYFKGFDNWRRNKEFAARKMAMKT